MSPWSTDRARAVVRAGVLGLAVVGCFVPPAAPSARRPAVSPPSAPAPAPACEEVNPKNACHILSDGRTACRCFHASGPPLEHWFERDGKKEGEYRRFHDNGQLAERGTYRRGLEEGRHERYARTGTPRSSVEYRRGTRHGADIVYFPDLAKPARRVMYRDGLAVESVELWPDGRVFREAVLDGDLVSWKVLSGQPRRDGSYRARQDGEDDENGVLTSVRVLEGPQRAYHANGALASEEVYANDRLISRERYDTEGRLLSSETFP